MSPSTFDPHLDSKLVRVSAGRPRRLQQVTATGNHISSGCRGRIRIECEPEVITTRGNQRHQRQTALVQRLGKGALISGLKAS